MLENKTLLLMLVSLATGALIGVFSTLTAFAFVMEKTGLQARRFPQTPHVAAGPMHTVDFVKQAVSSDLRGSPTELVQVGVSSDLRNVPREAAQVEVIDRVGEGDGQPMKSMTHGAEPEQSEVVDGGGTDDEQPITPISQPITPIIHRARKGQPQQGSNVAFPACNTSLANNTRAIQRLIPNHPDQLITLKNSCYERTDGNKNTVFLWSHRRSGTHATISLLLENFNNIAVIKTGHLVPDKGFRGGCEELQTWKTLGHHLYVFRNPLNCMVSLKAYARHVDQRTGGRDFMWQKNSFALPTSPDEEHSETVNNMNRLEFWKYHVASMAAQPNVAFLSFENITENPEYAVATLEKLFGWERETEGRIEKPHPAKGTVYYRGGKSDASEEFENKDNSMAWMDLQQPANLDNVLQCDENTPVEVRGSAEDELQRIVRSSSNIDGFPEKRFKGRAESRSNRYSRTEPPTRESRDARIERIREERRERARARGEREDIRVTRESRDARIARIRAEREERAREDEEDFSRDARIARIRAEREERAREEEEDVQLSWMADEEKDAQLSELEELRARLRAKESSMEGKAYYPLPGSRINGQ